MEKHRSFWLEKALEGEQTLPSFSGDASADVVIMGGGYVGLWTAIRMKQADPKVNVVVLEKDICGGGASGRNGGFVLSWWPKISTLTKLVGEKEAVNVAQESADSIKELKSFFEEHQIDAHFRWSPWLWTATSNAQEGAWESVVKLTEKMGLDVFERLSPEEVGKRSGSIAHRSGVLEKTAATVQPALYVRGLRRVALKLGVKIYENTEILSFSRTHPIQVHLPKGSIECDKFVIANNAWSAGIPELAKYIVAITSDMIVTAPAKEDLEKIGWKNGECITDSQMMVDYYHVTQDHRVAFGKGGWGIAYGGNFSDDFDRNPQRAKMVEADFRRYYPALKHIPVTHDWSGPIDRTPVGVPIFGRFEKNPNIIYGVGWSGNGVGPSVMGGKILAGLALGQKNRWGEHPLIDRHTKMGRFPPKPIRFIGAHIVRSAVALKERAEIEDKTPNFLSVQISKLAPSGLEDKE